MTENAYNSELELATLASVPFQCSTCQCKGYSIDSYVLGFVGSIVLYCC